MFLKSIPSDKRPNEIKILYQETYDKRWQKFFVKGYEKYKFFMLVLIVKILNDPFCI